ncbi:MAG: YigZ family protein [Balneolaceae bacterium]
MQTISHTYEAEFREKGSKFICILLPCNTADEATSALDSIRFDHPSATHHCYAFRVNPNEPEELSQDDGEPSGTAGIPILNTLRAANLMNCTAVVVRYYGGTKLGKSGLIQAYGRAVELAVEKASLKQLLPVSRYVILYPYSQQTVLEKLRHTFNLFEVSADYTDSVKIVLDCPQQDTVSFEKYLNEVEHLLTHWKKTGVASQIVANP